MRCLFFFIFEFVILLINCYNVSYSIFLFINEYFEVYEMCFYWNIKKNCVVCRRKIVIFWFCYFKNELKYNGCINEWEDIVLRSREIKIWGI